MGNNEIFFLVLIIFFCLLSVITLVFHVYSKSKIPLALFTVCAVGVIALSAVMLMSQNTSSKYVRDYIPITAAQKESHSKKKATTSTAESGTAASELKDSDIVYITKHGKKYHVSLDCGNYEFYECTLKEAEERGLEPCQNCTK